MLPHVADGHIMHGAWVPIMLHMGSALQGHEGARRRLFLCRCWCFYSLFFWLAEEEEEEEDAAESLIAGR